MDKQLLGNEAWAGNGFLGSWEPLAGGVVPVVEPATGEQLFEAARASAGDIAKASATASAAQPGWFGISYRERAEVFRRAINLLDQFRPELEGWIVRETGAIPPKATFEVDSLRHLLGEAASMPTQSQGVVLPSEQGVTSIAKRVPHGVIGVISPFNFPLILSSRSVLPALAVGNAVVLKPDLRTPMSGGLMLAALLDAAGLPKGVLSVLPGDAEAGEALVEDPRIAMISFTGSTAVGKKVGEAAGRNLKKVALELGGKNSFIVLDDADLDLAVSGGAWASWLHQGQICMSAGRHLVQGDLADVYAERMAKKASELPVGNPATDNVAIGPLISESQAKNVERIVDESVKMGAKLLAGGKRDGCFYYPTVLSGVTPDMPVFREEIFGPVVAISAFDTDDEAIALSNDTEYGLSAGIHTGDVGRGMAMADKLAVGLVHVNEQTVNDDCTMPMGGMGASGNGSRHGGPANWDEFCQWQWMTIRAKAPQYPL